jgi:hypothetical protein
VEGSCEHGNELSGSIKCWEILEQVRKWRLLKTGSAPCRHLAVCMCSHLIVARQQLGKYVPAAMNTHATTIEELLDAFFYAVRVISEESRRLVLPRISYSDCDLLDCDVM